MAAAEGYRVEYVALSELQRWPRNPKLHSEPELDASLERFGFTNPLMVDERSGKMVAGHGRLEALMRRQKAGLKPPRNIAKKGDEWLVPVIRGIAFKNDAEAEAYLVADNRLTERGGWNETALNEILKSLSETSSLDGTGYDLGDVEAMVRQVEQATSTAVVGATPEELLPKFQAAEIKQVVLYFESAQYDDVTARLEKVKEKLKLNSNTEVMVKLLEHWEAADGPVAEPANG